MKTFKTILAAVAIAFSALAASAQSMSYEAMRSNARFLTDRMAYELGITSMRVIDDIYRINFDYIYGVNEYLDEIALGYHYDDYMDICARRDHALRVLLGDFVWNRVLGFSYFHRPIIFSNYRWHFGIYDYDRYGVHHFFYGEPRHFHRHYTAGHFFHGMAPAGGHIHRPTPQPNRFGSAGGNRPGEIHNRPNNNERPQGGIVNSRPNGNDRPQGGTVNSRPNGNDRPQGGIVNSRPSGYDRQQGGTVSRGTTSGRSENNMRSSSRSSSATRSTATPTRSTTAPTRSTAAPTRSTTTPTRSTATPTRSGASRSSSGSSSRGSSGGSRGGRR